MGGVSSTFVKIYFEPSLAWKAFEKHKLRCILCPRLHGMGLVNACLDSLGFLAGMKKVCSTHVEMHFVSSLAWKRFSHPMLRCILFPRWHGRNLVNTRWYAFCSLARKEIGLVNTSCDMFCMGLVNRSWDAFCVISLTWGGFDQHNLR